jgi:hypothetical protein
MYVLARFGSVDMIPRDIVQHPDKDPKDYLSSLSNGISKGKTWSPHVRTMICLKPDVFPGKIW